MTLLSKPGRTSPFLLLSATLCAALAGCGERPKPIIEYRTAKVLPDASLVQDCDTSENDPASNAELADELTRTREQRDICAGQVKALKTWRTEAAKTN